MSRFIEPSAGQIADKIYRLLAKQGNPGFPWDYDNIINILLRIEECDCPYDNEGCKSLLELLRALADPDYEPYFGAYEGENE